MPLLSAQSVEVLVVADELNPYLAHHTRRYFLADQDRLLAERSDEMKEFMSKHTQLKEQQLRDPFDGWIE